MLISKVILFILVILLFHLDELSSITSFVGGSSQEICRRLKESFSKDDAVRVLNLRDVQTSRIYEGQSTFAKKFASCVSDCNRIFLITSDTMTQAVDKNEFPETSRLAEEETKKVFAEIINREKTYGKERSKIVLIDFFNDTNAPDKIKDLDFVENLFNGERDVTKLNDDILDTILSKCRFERKDLQGKENKKCIIS